VYQTDNFRDAILLATNLGNDTDTVAAVTGQIAGAFYGLSNIPDDWKNKLHDFSRFIDLTEELIKR
jgi:ADP-ribosylglycohydrolase